ncbi:osmoprotectant NAGGN system M42 family peptidase [Botrimarina sp.]|uniref:osmoprotectant NAGGN system M42 family peptidase n=1 Tax=Botrimarina sp. TaxID=2795802 RepID=UPI0032EABF38
MKKPSATDADYLLEKLVWLLGIHSPSGYTDPVVRAVCGELDELGLEYELTRRGAIRATLPGKRHAPGRAVVAHVDTLGAMVKELKDNGRLGLIPVGTWSARFAEGARVSIFTDDEIYRGQVMPLKASGHTYNEAVDTQPVSWENVEVRIDERCTTLRELIDLGVRVGDFVGFDAGVETFPNGYVTARHLDDKAGVAAILAAAKAIVESDAELPSDLYLLFTISEEVGSGASAVLHGDVAELIAVDNGAAAPGQASSEYGVTIAMADSTGPFDFHLTRHLIQLCKANHLQHARDIFRYYRCDAASAIEAGNDIRTALVAFGVDGSHGYERTNLDSLRSVADLLVAYATHEPLFATQEKLLGNLDSFPETRRTDVDGVRVLEGKPITQVTPPPPDGEELPIDRPKKKRKPSR